MIIKELEDKRSRPIHPKRLVAKPYSEAIKRCKAGFPIYKGLHLGFDAYKTDPKLLKRKSQYTSNHYTLLLSNLPVWRNWPKRDQSLICSTSFEYARNYGDLYIVLPKNGSKIGICPNNDIWNSFLGLTGIPLDKLNDFFKDIPDKTYLGMLRQLLAKRKTIATLLNRDDRTEHQDRWLNWLAERFQKAHNIEDIERIFNVLLNPVSAGFELSAIKDFKTSGNHEVWTDSEALLIRVNSQTSQDLGLI